MYVVHACNSRINAEQIERVSTLLTSAILIYIDNTHDAPLTTKSAVIFDRCSIVIAVVQIV